MSKYLYGVSVQGLQEFIFQTNKLKEIVGASRIIEGFDSLDLKKEFSLLKEPNYFLKAAGNLRCEIDNEDDIKILVKKLPKYLMEIAQDVNFSQACLELNCDYEYTRKKLETILKEQRNIVKKPIFSHLNLLKQNPRTAQSALRKEKVNKVEEYIDIAVSQKRKLVKDDEKIEIETLSNNKHKIAVIHADGNGLGKIVKDISKEDMPDFSIKLDKATKESYQEAVEEILSNTDEKKTEIFRKIILGGDDLTVICNANYALNFTKRFLELFEEKTKNIYNDYSLTASAGIAFCNEKYPFHYAVKLAEQLCARAKKDSKALKLKDKTDNDFAPSTLMFHNIQSSNIQNFEKLIEDELSIGDIKLDFGSYFLNQDNQVLISDLIELKNSLKKDSHSPSSRLREWLSTIDYNKDYAEAMMHRINEVTKYEDKYLFERLHEDFALDNLIVEKNGANKSPVYDILALLSVEDL